MIRRLSLLVLISAFQSYGGIIPVSFKGCGSSPIFVKGSASSGLDGIVVLSSLEGIKMEIQRGESDISVNKFDSKGIAYGESVGFSFNQSGNAEVDGLNGNTGYEISCGDCKTILWIVDYSKFRYTSTSITLSPDSGCDSMILDFTGTADPIYYFSVNGAPSVLSRDISLKYYTQEWDENTGQFIKVEEEKLLPSITSAIHIVPPPLCATSFVLSSDRFMKEWGHDTMISSPFISPSAVSGRTFAKQATLIPTNNISGGLSGVLGGSAPAEISFNSSVTDGVAHTEWQISLDSDFNETVYRFYDKDFDFTFVEDGTFFVRMIASNASGECEVTGGTFKVEIGSSVLKIPNAFSPDGDGVNDIWKVSYRSIVKFRCDIYDRQGHKIISLDNPSEGWDGKRGSSYVEPGVYYYVISATGADGRRYKKSGDINIVRAGGSH